MDKLVIFDLDGTICDTLEDLKNAVNYAMEKLNLPTHTLDSIRAKVGNGIRLLIERSLPDEKTNEINIQRAYDYFSEYYPKHLLDNTKPYEGIPQLLSSLKQKGYKLAVCSNKDDKFAKQIVNTCFPNTFDYIIGRLPDMEKKPAPNMVNKVLKELQVDKQNVLYVGDSLVDIQTAQNSNLKGVFVTWGFTSVDILKNYAKDIVSNPSKIIDFIK